MSGCLSHLGVPQIEFKKKSALRMRWANEGDSGEGQTHPLSSRWAPFVPTGPSAVTCKAPFLPPAPTPAPASLPIPGL